MDKGNNNPVQKDLRKVVISFLLSVIDIYLVVSLETWTKQAGSGAVTVFAAAGMAVFFLLAVRYLGQPERRLKVHSMLWGLAMAAAYVLGCRMRRDGTALGSLWELPALTAQTVCLAMPGAGAVALFLRYRKLLCLSEFAGGKSRKRAKLVFL